MKAVGSAASAFSKKKPIASPKGSPAKKPPVRDI
jgi:hypothetical protein